MNNFLKVFLSTFLMVTVLSACGKKSAKTATADEGTTERTATGFVPNNGGGGTSGGGNSVVRECSQKLFVSEEAIAGFFGISVVPADERSLSAEELKAKYIVFNEYAGEDRPIALMNLEGEPTYCLNVNQTNQSVVLKVEYEDHFGFSWITLDSSSTAPADRVFSKSIRVTESEKEVTLVTASGILHVMERAANSFIRFADMPSRAVYDSRSEADKTAVPFATTNTQHDLCRGFNKASPSVVPSPSSPSVDTCATNFAWSLSLWNESYFGLSSTSKVLTNVEKQAMRDRVLAIARKIASFTYNASFPFERYKILTGELTIN